MRIGKQAGRLAGVTLVVGLILAACDKGPDRTQVAASLQKDVEGYLAQMEGPVDQRSLSHGTVTVTPQQDAGYLVTIEGVKLTLSDAGYFDIGKLSYVLTPKDGKIYQADHLSIAQTIPYKAPDGKRAGGVTQTVKAFEGTWLKEASSFTKLDLQVADIAVDDPKTGGDLKMAGIAFAVDSTDKGQGLWDQVGKLTISGLNAGDKDGGKLTIASIDASSAAKGLKLIDYAAKMRALRQVGNQSAANKQSEAGAQPADGQTAAADSSGSTGTSPAASTAATAGNASGNAVPDSSVQDFIKALPGLIADSIVDLHVSGVTYQEREGGEAFELGKAGLNFAATGFDQPKATLTFTLDHDGLVLHTPDAERPFAKASLPATGALTVSLIDLPTADLVSVMADGAAAYATADPTQIEAKTTVFMIQLQQLLQRDGVKLRVEPSHLSSAAANLTADGDFVMKPAAIYGATGALNIAITGIDDLLSLAKKEAEEKPEAMQYVAALQALLGYAARATGSDGKPVDNFKIDVPQNGQMTVNGKPLQF
ncbi:hypothetical protein ACFPL7_19250 [Dongia soli]|uniref:Lipoprotein n=1 Tax=Dongia soli TaxID=600628 RepID=A0ABU5E6H2_9PROT|nr:hypothetical protein [Dongia soli]MDY0881729.1 hypothetical protein [Dongia soli]